MGFTHAIDSKIKIKRAIKAGSEKKCKNPLKSFVSLFFFLVLIVCSPLPFYISFWWLYITEALHVIFVLATVQSLLCIVSASVLYGFFASISPLSLCYFRYLCKLDGSDGTWQRSSHFGVRLSRGVRPRGQAREVHSRHVGQTAPRVFCYTLLAESALVFLGWGLDNFFGP